MSDDNFLARWSRRKIERKTGREAEPAAPDLPRQTAAMQPPARQSSVPAAPTDPLPTVGPKSAGAPADAAERAADAQAEAEVRPAPPTLADVAMLTRDDSFARFVAPGVDPSVRNAAMKKLFSDPHYNVMDGLDIYIDDYGKPDPIPMAMLRRMTQSKSLGLFEREEAEEAEAAEKERRQALAETPAAEPEPSTRTDPEAATLPTVAETSRDEDPDLQLQPDDGTRRAGAGPGAEDGAES